MKRLQTIALMLGFLSSYGQDLFIPQQAELTISSNAIISTGTNLINNGRVEIATGSSYMSMGNITNTGFLINNGQLELYQNWVNVGTFNTSMGEMIFAGSSDQKFASTYLPIATLTISKMGKLEFEADSIKITDELKFVEGVLNPGENTRFIVDSDADIIHEAGSQSYFEGTMISRGTGYRIFPVGDGGYFGTLSFLEMQGTGNSNELEIALEHLPIAAMPGEDLIGISDQNRWKIKQTKGDINHAVLQIDFEEENLESFTNQNTIRRKYDSPVIAISDSIVGPYHSLGVESLIATDSVTYGTIIGAESVALKKDETRYFGVALAPTVDPKGEIFFPNVFAPSASDIRNQSYKVFGELIAEKPFQIRIYNRFSTLVYQADSFEEANKEGWNGLNESGKEEESGVFFVFVQYAYQYEPERIHEYSGSLLLKR